MKLDDGDDASNLSSENDADIASDKLANQHDSGQDIEADHTSGDLEISTDHEQADYSNDWLSSEEDQDSWVDYDVRSIGCDTVNDQKK